MSYRIVEDAELAKRNESLLLCGDGSPAYNAVLKVELSDEQAALDGNGSNINILNYTSTAPEGEISFQDDRLIGVLVYEVTKDGIEFTKVADFSDPIKKQYKHDSTTGEIIFPISMDPGEDSIVKYIGQNSAITGGEPVSLAEAKEWIRVDIDDDDNLIQMLITACRIMCEKAANLSFIPRTVTATIINRLGYINLPYGPVTGTVAYTQDDDDLTALTDFNLRTGYEDRVIASYTAGYSVLPKNLKTALLNQIAWSYENRGDVAKMGSLSPLSMLVLGQIRVET